MSSPCNVLDWVDTTDHIGDLTYGNQSCPLCQQFVQLGNVEHPFGRESQETQRRTSFLRNHLPRYQVGVMLHDGQQNFIAFTKVCPCPSESNEVDGLRSIPCGNYLVRVSSINELGNFCAGALKCLSGSNGQGVHAAVHVAVVRPVKSVQFCENLERFLRSSSIVQIYYWNSGPLLFPQNREVFPSCLEVNRLSLFGDWQCTRNSTPPPCLTPGSHDSDTEPRCCDSSHDV
mmetsp:Transcript_62781/g.204902  ORF Transcript_62781/g.204902 Transcript_62781/m.204902 type:complete len:231 (-) Transcript_62781:268-960(-)